MKNVIFIAPPATGKGTISDYLVNDLGYVHISTGDILREVSKEESIEGKNIARLMQEGKFIGDDIILPLFEKELISIKDKSFILDGMPRTLYQARYLEELFSKLNINNYVVINLDINEDILLKRATGRRICEKCKASYNIYFDDFKPKVLDTCDKCQSKLIQRDDDTESTFKNRYNIYLEQTLPLIDFYQEKGLLKKVDANQNNQSILNEVVKILKGDEL